VFVFRREKRGAIRAFRVSGLFFIISTSRLLENYEESITYRLSGARKFWRSGSILIVTDHFAAIVFKGWRECSAENRMSGRKALTEIVKSGTSAVPEGEVTHYQIKGAGWLTG